MARIAYADARLASPGSWKTALSDARAEVFQHHSSRNKKFNKAAYVSPMADNNLFGYGVAKKTFGPTRHFLLDNLLTR